MKYEKLYHHKYRITRNRCVWVKTHIASGVRTNVVTAVRILDQHAHDSPQFVPLVKETKRHFEISEVPADKAYASLENFEAVAECGGQAFIAFRSNHTGAAGGHFVKAFHYFQFHQDEYMAHYHKRSNVESTFSAIKRKFGADVVSKNPAAMVNEVLCKIICHNLTCLIQEQEALGIVPVFWKDEQECEAAIRPLTASAAMGNCSSSDNAVQDQARHGCVWRALPPDLPPDRAAFHDFRARQADGTWDRIHDALRATVRGTAGKRPKPSVAIVDGRTGKGTEHSGPNGSDGGVQRSPAAARATPAPPGGPRATRAPVTAGAWGLTVARGPAAAGGTRTGPRSRPDPRAGQVRRTRAVMPRVGADVRSRVGPRHAGTGDLAAKVTVSDASRRLLVGSGISPTVCGSERVGPARLVARNAVPSGTAREPRGPAAPAAR